MTVTMTTLIYDDGNVRDGEGEQDDGDDDDDDDYGYDSNVADDGGDYYDHHKTNNGYVSRFCRQHCLWANKGQGLSALTRIVLQIRRFNKRGARSMELVRYWHIPRILHMATLLILPCTFGNVGRRNHAVVDSKWFGIHHDSPT